jgi:hypothetical protein
MPKPPPAALNDAIKASMDEAHENLMKAVRLSRSLSVDFNREECAKFKHVHQRYESFYEVRERDHQTLLNLDAKAQSSDDRIEYTLRLLAIVERHTEEMGEIAGAFNKVILSHADRKKNGE